MGTHCPVGTFSNRQGLQNSSECDACTPGYYCGQTGLTAESGTCWAGGLILPLCLFLGGGEGMSLQFGGSDQLFSFNDALIMHLK